MYNQNELNDIIGKNIKYYRELYNVGKDKEIRITRGKLAELIDVSTSLVGNMEREKQILITKEEECKLHSSSFVINPDLREVSQYLQYLFF